MDHDLDDELRRLFSDDRLDVHTTPDATDAVVRGADRRRRRRTAVTTAFAVVALVGAGLGVTMLRMPSPEDGAGDLLPTASSTASSTSTTPPPSSVVVSTVTVTTNLPPSPPTGTDKPDTPNAGTPSKARTTTPPPTPEIQAGRFGVLALGMSEADALGTGELIEPGTPVDAENRCKGYSTRNVPDDAAVIVSPAMGIVRITYPAVAKTPKNVGAGSTVADVKAAYPSATQSGSDLVVAMTATPKWFYVFENDGAAVTTVRMRLAANDCPVA